MKEGFSGPNIWALLYKSRGKAHRKIHRQAQVSQIDGRVGKIETLQDGRTAAVIRLEEQVKNVEILLTEQRADVKLILRSLNTRPQ